MPTKECDTCKNVKDVGEFNKTNDGACYNNCKDCFANPWGDAQLNFWKTKRQCAICTRMLPLPLYAKDYHGIFFKECRACFNKAWYNEQVERESAETEDVQLERTWEEVFK